MCLEKTPADHVGEFRWNWYGNQFHEIDWAREGYSAENTIGILEKDVKSFLKAVEAEPLPEDSLLLERLRRLETLIRKGEKILVFFSFKIPGVSPSMLHHGKPEIPDFRMQLPEHSPVHKLKAVRVIICQKRSLAHDFLPSGRAENGSASAFPKPVLADLRRKQEQPPQQAQPPSVSVADGPLIEIGKGQHVPIIVRAFSSIPDFARMISAWIEVKRTGVILQAAFCKRNEPGPAVTTQNLPVPSASVKKQCSEHQHKLPVPV